jgi:hypothetical protein
VLARAEHVFNNPVPRLQLVDNALGFSYKLKALFWVRRPALALLPRKLCYVRKLCTRGACNNDVYCARTVTVKPTFTREFSNVKLHQFVGIANVYNVKADTLKPFAVKPYGPTAHSAEKIKYC